VEDNNKDRTACTKAGPAGTDDVTAAIFLQLPVSGLVLLRASLSSLVLLLRDDDAEEARMTDRTLACKATTAAAGLLALTTVVGRFETTGARVLVGCRCRTLRTRFSDISQSSKSSSLSSPSSLSSNRRSMS
jgi:hypothetical protein